MKRKEIYATKQDRLGIVGILCLSLGLSYGLCLSNPTSILRAEGGELLSPYISSEFIVRASEVVPVEEKPLTQKQEIMIYIVEKFGDDANLAITMLTKCENHSLNPRATNQNRNGTTDRGVFQINSIHGGEEMYDYKKNVDKAYEIYHRQGNTFKAWTCAPQIGQENYLGQK